LVVFIMCSKFDCDWCISFESMKVLKFGGFILNQHIHTPKLGFLGDFIP